MWWKIHSVRYSFILGALAFMCAVADLARGEDASAGEDGTKAVEHI